MLRRIHAVTQLVRQLSSKVDAMQEECQAEARGIKKAIRDAREEAYLGTEALQQDMQTFYNDMRARLERSEAETTHHLQLPKRK